MFWDNLLSSVILTRCYWTHRSIKQSFRSFHECVPTDSHTTVLLVHSLPVPSRTSCERPVQCIPYLFSSPPRFIILITPLMEYIAFILNPGDRSASVQ